MIQLKLSFGEGQPERSFEITKGETLKSAIDRALDGVPLGKFEKHETFNVIVNGMIVEKDFWGITRLEESDIVNITPKVGSGESGQIFKQVLIIAVTVVASVLLSPGAGATIGAQLLAAAEITAITIGATLLLNALIPPPVASLGEFGAGGGDISGSQMYSFSGQSNQMHRLGIVPRVYGKHRMFPNVAAIPYTELATSKGAKAGLTVDAVTYEAKAVGTLGNAISVRYLSGGTAGSETVSVSGKAITVTLQVGVSTAAQVAAKVALSAAAKALVSAIVTGDSTTTQGVMDATILGGGEDAGETIQYLYAVYDFGIGTMKVSELKIGDTPLTTDSFRDFEMRLVDPNKPDVDADDFDATLEKNFKFYSSRRVVTGLSLAMVDGDEFTQNSDENTNLDPMEIILNFVCPRGLFGFSSSGTYGDRSVKMEIHFALVGTDDWQAYNDVNYVDSYESTGGTDVTNFDVKFYPDGVSSTYYQEAISGYGSYNSDSNTDAVMYIKPNTKKLLVPDDDRYEVGAKVFSGARLLGIIETITDLTGGKTELTLDRVITTRMDIQAYTHHGYLAYEGSPIYEGQSTDIKSVTTTRHESAAAVITGKTQNPVYGHFRFSPKTPGQYKVRVRRVLTSGTFVTQTADSLSWVGISTSIKAAPVQTTKRHCFLELKIKATNQLNGHIQNLSGVVSSVLNAYDSETETWSRQETNNPAWVFCDLLTGDINKKPVDLGRLDLDSISEWAEYCAEVPTPPPSATYLEPRFQCNFILDYETTLQGVLNQVGSMAQASLNIINGKYGVLIDKLKTTPVQIFTPRNSKDFSSNRFYGPRPHAVKVKYIDPQLNWEITETVVYDNGYNATNATEFDELTSFACTNHEQAWRFGRYMIAQNKLRQENIGILVDFENLICSRGDYVQICQDVMRVGGRPARVKGVETYTGFDGFQQITLFEIDDSLDIDEDEDYGYCWRSKTGEITTNELFFDPGICTKQIITADNTPTGGSITFRYRGEDCVVAASDFNTFTMLFALRAAWTFDDDLEFNIDTTNVFQTQYLNQFGELPHEITIVSNTLTYGGGDVVVTSEIVEGRSPDNRKFSPTSGYEPEAGDLLIIGILGQITYDCIVKSISPNDDMSAGLSLIEKADEIFDYESSDTLPDYDPQISDTSNPEFKPPKAVENLEVSDNDWECSDTRSGYKYFVELLWDMPPGSVFEHFEIWVNDGKGYKAIDTTTSKIYRYDVDQSRLDIEHKFKVVAVAASGNKLQLIQMSEVTTIPTTKTDPPSDVEDFAMNITNQVLQLAWTHISDCDLFEYEIRFSPETNDLWESSIPLQRVSKSVNSLAVQARTGVYLIKAIDFAGNQSENAARTVTTIPNLFDLNVIETINDAPTFIGTLDETELLGESVILAEEVPSEDADLVQYYDEGFYTCTDLLDLGDVFTVRLQSQVRADGLKKGELMSEWESLEEVEHLNTATTDDWDVLVEYRATDTFAAMSDWAHLSEIDHINYGAGVGYTDWRPIPTVGDATGRIFQFRIKLVSNSPNVTPRLFDGSIKADMPDRIDSFENLTSSASDATVVTYDNVFMGPGTSPAVQISIDDAQAGDYWAFDYKTLEGFAIRFYDILDVQVVRQFDVMAKGYGRRHTVTI